MMTRRRSSGCGTAIQVASIFPGCLFCADRASPSESERKSEKTDFAVNSQPGSLRWKETGVKAPRLMLAVTTNQEDWSIPRKLFDGAEVL